MKFLPLFISVCLFFSVPTWAAENTPTTSDKKLEQQKEIWIVRSQDGIRKKLKDPSSAKFQNSLFVEFEGIPMVCGEVNAKNSFGAYEGFQRFVAGGSNMAFLESEVADFENLWSQICTASKIK